MQKLDLQMDYWNTVGPRKLFAHPVNLDRLKQSVGSDDRILDYGCGRGRALGFLYSHGYRHLIGVDPAPAMIAAARQAYPSIAFETLEEPPRVALPDASVHAVLLFAVLTCIPADEGQRAVLQEINRVLRPGGLLYVSDMWLQTDARNVERYVRDEKKYGIYGVFDLAEGVTVRHHEQEWIESLTTGYERIVIDEIPVQTMNGHPAQAFQWFGFRRHDLATQKTCLSSGQF